jgi:hypothetical protein
MNPTSRSPGSHKLNRMKARALAAKLERISEHPKVGPEKRKDAARIARNVRRLAAK